MLKAYWVHRNFLFGYSKVCHNYLGQWCRILYQKYRQTCHCRHVIKIHIRLTFFFQNYQYQDNPSGKYWYNFKKDLSSKRQLAGKSLLQYSLLLTGVQLLGVTDPPDSQFTSSRNVYQNSARYRSVLTLKYTEKFLP